MLDSAGIGVSMVTGDFDIPPNNDNAPQALRHITPYLDLAASLGSDLIRIAMKKEDDIAWAQRASDEARERHIRLAHQSHQSTVRPDSSSSSPRTAAATRSASNVAPSSIF